MSDSPHIYRVTVRLTPELYAQLAAQGRSGKPLAAIVRDALLDSLARQPALPSTAESTAPLVTAMAAMTARLDSPRHHFVDTSAASSRPCWIGVHPMISRHCLSRAESVICLSTVYVLVEP
jgi:hypothetical protein